MRISEAKIRRIINEEVRVYRRNLTIAQFGYIIHSLMESPEETVSEDLYEPKKGELILKKGESLLDITGSASYTLYKEYNIDLDTPAYTRRKQPHSRPTPRLSQTPARSQSTGPSDIESVASSLLGYVRSGSRPLRNDIKNITSDTRRGEIAVYLKDPKDRIASDQEIACALRYLLDQRVKPSGRFVINPCGFDHRPSSTLIVIVKL